MNQKQSKTISFLKNKSKYDQGRYSLLLVTILSVVNLFSIVLTDTYYLFSSYITQFLAIEGALWYIETQQVVFPIVFGVIGFVTVIPYFLCFLFSKKRAGWMIAALVLFSLDSVLFLIDFVYLIAMGDLSMLIDLAIRIWVLVSLALGVKYGLRTETSEAEMKAEAEATALDYDPEAGDAFDEMAAVTRTLTVARAKSFVGCAMKTLIFVNGKEVESLKNGETKTVQINGKECELFILGPNNVAISNTVTVPAGYDNKSYTVKCKTGFSTMQIILEEGTLEK